MLFDPIEFNKRLLIIGWVLVLSKCLILEYYTQYLSIPINSTFFIWTLSIGLTSLVSYLFLKRNNSLRIVVNKKLRIRVLFNTIVCLIILVINSANLFLNCFNLAYLMAANFTFLGIYFITNGLLKHDKWKFIAGSYLMIASVYISQCEFLSVYLYSSFFLIILAIQLIIDLIYYRKTTITTE